jgi:hypothetical protein
MKEVSDIFIFENGNIALFDEKGEQLVELQEQINQANKYLWWRK